MKSASHNVLVPKKESIQIYRFTCLTDGNLLSAGNWTKTLDGTATDSELAFELFIKEDRTKLLDTIERCKAHAGNEYKVILRHIRGGNLIPLEWKLSAEDTGNELLLIRASGHSKESNRLTNQSYTHIIENLTDLVLIIGKHGQLVYASPYVTFRYGYSSEELINQSLLDFIHQDDHKRVLQSLETLTAFSVAPESLDHRILHKDGSWHWVESKGSVDPNSEQIIIICRDITDRHKFEKKLSQLGTLFNLTNDIMLVSDNKGVINFINPKCIDVLGYSQDKLLEHKSGIRD